MKTVQEIKEYLEDRLQNLEVRNTLMSQSVDNCERTEDILRRKDYEMQCLFCHERELEIRKILEDLFPEQEEEKEKEPNEYEAACKYVDLKLQPHTRLRHE